MRAFFDRDDSSGQSRPKGLYLALLLSVVMAASWPAAALEIAVDSKEAQGGEVVSLGVHLTDADALGALTLDVTYVGPELELLEVTPGGALAEASFATNPELYPSVSGLIRFSGVVPQGFTGDGELLRLTFSLPDSISGSFPVTVVQAAATSIALEDVDIVLRNGGLGLVTGVSDAEAALPSATQLLYNYPNPFNAGTQIPYQLSTAAQVVIDLYSIDGRRVRRLELGFREAGYYAGRSGGAAYWDGRDDNGRLAASGVYLCVMRAGSERFVRKVTLLK